MKKEEIENLEPCTLQEIQQRILSILVDIVKVCDKYHINYWLSDGTLLGAVRHEGFIPWDDDIDIAMPYEDYVCFMEVAQKELGDKYFVQNYHTDPEYRNVVVLTKIRDNNSIFIEEFDTNYHQGAFVDIFVMNRYESKNHFYRLKKEYYRVRSAAKMNTYDFESSKKRISKKLLSIVFFWMSRERVIRKGEEADRKHKQHGDMFSYGFTTPMSVKYSFPVDSIFPLKKMKFEEYQFNVPCCPEIPLKTYYGDFMKLPSEDKRTTHSQFYCLLDKK